MGKQEAKYLRIYFILSYVIFWVLIVLTGLIIFLKAPLLIQNIMKNLCAWTPTFVIILMFKKLYPNTTFKQYINENFKKKIEFRDFISSFLLQLFVLVAAVLSFFVINKMPIGTITLIGGSSVIPLVIMDLTGGALGEELGWRGYALNTLQKKYTSVSASLILGVIWGLWHLPLMLLSGYSGVNLVYYIIAFMLAIISFSVVITFYYNKSKNILIAMSMHFWFNFLMKIVVIDILPLLIYTSILYFVFAVVIVVLSKKHRSNEVGNRD